MKMTPDQPNNLSERLLLDVKKKKDTSSIQLQLAELALDFLAQQLINDDHKKAFWINIYNAYYQILRVEKKTTKSAIYKKKLFSIAGNLLSLDDVEHGILRKYRYKYSFGLFAHLFPSKFNKSNAVNDLDYRIHFALNCGAKSCPPIAFYHAEAIHAQLDLATQSFLEGESDFNDESKVIYTTALFKWFYYDFGGSKGIRRIIAEQLNKDVTDYTIKYKKYSWEDDLANFV
jgi:hypothetical protein